MQNPFHRDTYDLDAQAALLADGSRVQETYAMMLDAGWTPEAATDCLSRLEASRRVAFKDKQEERSSGKLAAIIGVIIVLVMFTLWLVT